MARPNEVVKPIPPPHADPTPPNGYLNETKSKAWLQKHGYEVIKPEFGFRLKKVAPVDFALNMPLFDNSKWPLRENKTLIKFNGKIYISDKK